MSGSNTLFASELKRIVPLLPAAPEKLDALISRLESIEPISEARLDSGGRLRIRYDASCVSIRDIERFMDEAGVARPSGAWWRFKSAWYRFVDDNARSNALSAGGACCSRPPSPWRSDRSADGKD